MPVDTVQKDALPRIVKQGPMPQVNPQGGLALKEK